MDGMTVDRNIFAEPHRLCPYCKEHPTEVVSDTIQGIGGVDLPGGQQRRCTDRTCEGRRGWPLNRDPDPQP
jgi:hypothetical protein